MGTTEAQLEEISRKSENLVMSWHYECPYCSELLPSRKTLRRHVGKVHREKVDDFTGRYRGGRTIPPLDIQELQVVHGRP